jgi:Transposase DNA-binding
MTSWIDKELAGCGFRDVRLGKRFRLLVERLSQAIGETIPMACQDWAKHESGKCGRTAVLGHASRFDKTSAVRKSWASCRSASILKSRPQRWRMSSRS